MKSIVLFTILFSSISIFACDELLRSFPRDCKIQDRFLALKANYEARGIDIDEIAEYRVIRFVDRSAWEHAKAWKTRPESIYKPAPDTWKVWDSGIRAVKQASGGKNQLYQNYVLNEESISFINKNLLMNEALNMNVKDKISDASLKPGEFRKTTSLGVGFKGSHGNYSAAIERSEASMDRFQQKWEEKMGAPFAQLLRNAGALFYENANMKSGMNYDKERDFVAYAPSAMVPVELSWIENFIQLNLEKYQQGKPVLAPVEFSAIVQKWFVSLHPFSDGNGRTSRAIQDIILAHFDMPVAPGGDLQDDATAVYEDYLGRTYDKFESMLATLELCQTLNAQSFHCQTIEKINAMTPEAPPSGFQKSELRRD